MKGILLAAPASLLLVSCYNSPSVSISEKDLDMVITNYSNEISYGSAYTTYVISDSIGLASNSDDVTVEEVNEAKFRSNIKTAINNNMQSYGYVPFDSSIHTKPDIFIPVTVTYLSVVGVSYYPIYYGGPGYSWGYPSYGYGGYSYYYSWSYVPSYYSYDEGSILIDWIDIKNSYSDIIGTDTIFYANNVWNMGIQGIIRNTSESDRNTRISQAINQGFEQSQYLKK